MNNFTRKHDGIRAPFPVLMPSSCSLSDVILHNEKYCPVLRVYQISLKWYSCQSWGIEISFFPFKSKVFLQKWYHSVHYTKWDHNYEPNSTLLAGFVRVHVHFIEHVTILEMACTTCSVTDNMFTGANFVETDAVHVK